MYVCMYVWMDGWMDVSVCVCMCLYVFCMCLYVSVCVCMCLYVSVCVCMCLYVSVCIYACMCMCVCVCVCVCKALNQRVPAGGQQPISLCCPTKLWKMWWKGSWTHEPVPALCMGSGEPKNRLADCHVMSCVF